MTSEQPAIGDTAYDARLKRIGVVVGILGELVQLRPRAGGYEWTARRAVVRPATASERLSEGVAAANAVSRGQL